MNDGNKPIRIEEIPYRAHRMLTSSSLMLRFTWATRVLLSIGFLSPGLTKLLGHRFVTTVTDDVIGQFFEALYQTGGYWRFLGATQVIAAVLIVFSKTSCLGTFLFSGIIANIAMITLSMPFGRTFSVAFLMMVACVYLMVWEYPRWRSILFAERSLKCEPIKSLTGIEIYAFAAVLVGGWGVTCVMRSLIEFNYLTIFWSSLAISFLGGATLAVVWARVVFGKAIKLFSKRS